MKVFDVDRDFTVLGDVSVRIGVGSAPTVFQARIKRFLSFYLGDENTRIPFGGRDTEIADLNEWLGAQGGVGNHLVTAPAGRGKTALLVRWVAQLVDEVEVAFIPISIRFHTNLEAVFYQALAARLAGVLGLDLESTVSDPATFYREKVIEYFDLLEQSDKRCLIVIDGLDEAAGWQVDSTVLPPRPPQNLKILVSARQLAGDKGSKGWLRRLGWTRPRSDAIAMEVPLLGRAGIEDVLEKMGDPLAGLTRNVDIIGELYRLTEHGDPLLLEYYVYDLCEDQEQTARLTPEKLAALEPGFGAYFRDWFSEQRSLWKDTGVDFSQDLINAILGVLACALGPLKLQDVEQVVRRIFRTDHVFTAETLRPLRRFVIGDGINTGYAFAHPKLAEYIERDYFGESQFISDIKTAYVEWGSDTVQRVNGSEVEPSETPEYLLLFYTQHLEQEPRSAAAPRFRDLVEDGWRQAWEAFEGGQQGIARDIRLAWRCFEDIAQADSETLREPRIGLGGQIRCALCLSSIRSVGTSIPANVLAEFVRHSAIGPKQALYFATVRKDWTRGDTIAALAPLLPSDLVDEALAAAHGISSLPQRVTAVAALLPRLPSEKAGREGAAALGLVKSMTEESAIAGALVDLGPHLPAELREEAKDVARKIELSFWRDDAIKALTSDLNASGETPAGDTTVSAPPTGEGSVIDDLLRRLAPYLAATAEPHEPGTRESSIFDFTWRLGQVEGSLPSNVVTELLESACGAVSDFDRQLVFDALAPHMSAEVLGNELQKVLKSGDGHALAGLAKHIPPDLVSAAVKAALVAEPEYIRRFVFEGLSSRLSEETFRQVFVTAGEAQDADALSGLLKTLPPALLPDAVEATRNLPSTYSLTAVIEALAPHLSHGQYRQELEHYRESNDGYALEGLVQSAPEDLVSCLLSFTREVEPSYQRRSIAQKLAPRLTLDQIRDELLKAEDTNNVDVLVGLLAFAVPDQLPELLGDVLSGARELPDGFRHPDVVQILAPHLSAPQARRLVQPALESGDGVALSSLIEFVPSDQLDDAITVARELGDNWNRRALFNALGAKLAQNQFRDLLPAIEASSDEYALSGLVEHLPDELLLDALAVALKVHNAERRAEILTELFPRVLKAGHAVDVVEIYQLVSIIGDDSARAFALAALMPNLDSNEQDRHLASVTDAVEIRSELTPQHDSFDLFQRFACVVLLARHLDEAEANDLIQWAYAASQETNDNELRPAMLAILALGSPFGDAKRYREEAVAAVDSLDSEEEAPKQIIRALLSKAAEEALAHARKVDEPAARALCLALTILQWPEIDVADLLPEIWPEDPAEKPEHRQVHALALAVASPRLPPEESDKAVASFLDHQAKADPDIEDFDDVTVFAMAYPFLPDEALETLVLDLIHRLSILPRQEAMVGLALAEGCVADLIGIPKDSLERDRGGNVLERLGGHTAVIETAAAIEDVGRWWA